LTDSGGIQEETTYLGIPCLTLRKNTERPITTTQGTNRLCRTDEIEAKVEKILNTVSINRQIPQLWDGHTAQRICNSIKFFFSKDIK